MKRITFCIAFALHLASVGCAEELTVAHYKSLPRFGIPDKFFTVRDYNPLKYLSAYVVPNVNTELSHSEKLSAALLIIAADHATTEKYHQSYGVSMKSPIMLLLAKNFQGLKDVKASHDVNPDELPIFDLGQYFREWMKKDLSKELQQERIEADRRK